MSQDQPVAPRRDRVYCNPLAFDNLYPLPLSVAS